MKNFFTTKRICRAGVIAALYVVLTWQLVPFAYGPFQLRPAEALCILPLFFPESIVALYIGCMIANALSIFGLLDVFLGSLATLIAATLTFACGKFIRNTLLKVIVGGFFPVIVNAFIVPAVWILADPTNYSLYWYNFGVMILNEAVWVYALGIPLYYGIIALQKRGVGLLLDKKKTVQPADKVE